MQNFKVRKGNGRDLPVHSSAGITSPPKKPSLAGWLIPSFGCVALAAIAAPIVGNSEFVAVAPVLAWLINLSVTLLVGAFAWNQSIAAVRDSRQPERMGSAVLAPLALLTVTVPSISLVWRTRTANVERLTGIELASSEALTFALLLFAACVLSFWIGEGIIRPVQDQRHPIDTNDIDKWKSAQLILMFAGVTTAVTRIGGDRALEFSERGTQEGQGVAVLLWWCLPLGIGIGFLFKHWGSRWRLLLGLGGIALIVNSGVRSPLLVIAIALVPLVLNALAKARRPARVWVMTSAGTYVLLAVGGAISAWRGSIRYGTPVSFNESLWNALANPLRSLTTSGFDTVDGLILVHSLPAGVVDASLFDLLKIFQTAVPRQLYPDKPEFISNIISRDLLGFGAAGMFMSGPGYLILIGGGWLVAILLFAAGGLVFRQSAGRRFGGVAWLICTYTLVRFFMGGDAFDFYQGLTLVAIATLALLIAKLSSLFPSNARSPETLPLTTREPRGMA